MRNINHKNIELNGNMVNLKTFYNTEFLEKTRHFIVKNQDAFVPQTQEKPNPNSTPIMSNKNLLTKMNIDSNLANTVPFLRQSAENTGNKTTISKFS